MTLKEKIYYLFFPRRCMCCSKVISAEEYCCEKCKCTLPEVEDEKCLLCGIGKEYCKCENKINNYEKIVAPFYYEGGIRNALLKMKRVPIYADYLAYRTNEEIKKYFSDVEIDYITFVPMRDREIEEKGFSHAEAFAQKLGCYSSLNVENTLKIVSHSEPQHSLPKSLRAGNVRGIYDIIDSEKVNGKTILLVDDIKTSGATLNECALMLNLYGAKSVYCAVAAVVR